MIQKALLITLIAQCLLAQTDSLLRLWYDQPAEYWVEALPVGNGRLGAMVFGTPSRENVQLNEHTIWAGQPYRNDSQDARDALAPVRQLIFDGKYEQAQDLVNRSFIARNAHGMPYQTAGNLHLLFPGHERTRNYYRELDIGSAVATTRYDMDGVTYQRQVFASHPDQVIVVNLMASQPASISFTALLNHPAPVDLSVIDGNRLVMSGVTSDHESVPGGAGFRYRSTSPQTAVRSRRKQGVFGSAAPTLQHFTFPLPRISRIFTISAPLPKNELNGFCGMLCGNLCTRS
ncbi:MAG: glycoside hydrolase family 95 protein [candidate division KSB1 bacterium]|nr:glycoside hydrolase family 95 protein [candidate division KSB1 bacterium]